MAEFLNRGRCGCADALSQSVLITLVVLFKQIQSNAMKMVQGRLYSFSRETNWVSIFKYLIWNRFYTKSNEKNKLVINNLLRLTSYHRGNSPASKFLQHSRQHWILTSGLWFNKRAIFFIDYQFINMQYLQLGFSFIFQAAEPKLQPCCSTHNLNFDFLHVLNEKFDEKEEAQVGSAM